MSEPTNLPTDMQAYTCDYGLTLALCDGEAYEVAIPSGRIGLTDDGREGPTTMWFCESCIEATNASKDENTFGRTNR